MRGRQVMIGVALMLAACLHRRIVNPDIVTPGAPGNSGKERPAVLTPDSDPAGELIFLGTNIVTLQAGTSLSVRLTDPLSTAHSRSGDAFDGLLAAPLVSGETPVAPAGTPVRGQITAVRPLDKETQAELSLNLLEIMINGRWFPLQTELIVFRETRAGGASLPDSGPGNPPGARVIDVIGASIDLPSGQTLPFHLTRRTALESSGVEKKK